LLVAVSVVLLAAAVLLGVGIGAVSISPGQSIAILARHAGMDLGIGFEPQQDAVLWAIRLPRVLLGVLVGAGLAVSGAGLQAVFRNPLADSGVIGVSSGASVGAALAIVLGLTGLGLATLPVAAFVAALVVAFVVYALSRYRGRTEVVTLLLIGMAVNAIAGAAIGLLLFVSTDQELRTVVFWTLGSLGSATWHDVLAAAPFVLAGVVVVPFLARDLNLFALGEDEARHLGVDTERVRLAVIALAALATGAAVAVAGIVAFVGLIVPHLVRLVAGPDNRIVLPVSALAGAALLVLADLVSRTVAVPRELPLGVMTALLGGPFFLWLVARARGAAGGWS
jgi:iron complex transport system permease protein